MRTLGSQVKAASRVGGPALVSRVPEVIGVGVGRVLNTVVALSVKPVLGLQSLGEVASSVPLKREHDSDVSRNATEQNIQRSSDVLLSHLSVDEESLEVLHESLRQFHVHRRLQQLKNDFYAQYAL